MAMYDPTIYGTPVNMLQIPAPVMQLISARMRDTSVPSVKFTQDGMKADELARILTNPKDFACAGDHDMEVRTSSGIARG